MTETPPPTEWSQLELSEQIERLLGESEFKRRAERLEAVRDAAVNLNRALIQQGHLCHWTANVEELRFQLGDALLADCRHLHVAMHVERRAGVNNIGDPYVELEEVVTCVECGKVISKAPPLTDGDIPV